MSLMLILGITGGIATGKSTVTQLFASLGAYTISADTLAHDLLTPGTDTTRAVLRAFPECAAREAGTEQTIDRKALGRVIFGDPKARARLEALTHPPIIAALTAQLADWRSLSAPPIAAAEIPLLFEAHLEYLVDRIIVVACAEPIQIARLCQRTGIDQEEAHRRIASQWPLSDKITRAHYVLSTDVSLEATHRQVTDLWSEFTLG